MSRVASIFVSFFLSDETFGAAPLEAAPVVFLHRNPDRYPGPRIPAIKQVVSIVYVIDVDVVRVIPVVSPVFRPWVDGTEPVSAILETRVSSHHHEREDADSEPMIPSKVSAETFIGNTVSVVSATLRPSAVIRLPVTCAMLLPITPMGMLKIRLTL